MRGMNYTAIRDLARQEERLRWAVERQRAKCTRITPTISGMPRASGNGQRMEEDVIRLTILKENWEAVRQELDSMRAELRPWIRKLKDGTQRTAMTMRYIENRRIGEIAETMAYSESQVFRILRRAEEEIRRRGKHAST